MLLVTRHRSTTRRLVRAHARSMAPMLGTGGADVTAVSDHETFVSTVIDRTAGTGAGRR